MTFVYPWALFFAVLPIIWLAWEWFSGGRPAKGFFLKAAALVCVGLALAQPRLKVNETKVAVAIAADTSASVSREDLASESALADRIELERGRNWNRLMAFARETRDVLPEERHGGEWSLGQTAGEAGRGTNLESAIRDAAATLPAGMVPRILLISDGHENLGSAARAVWQAQQLGIPVDTAPLAGRARPGLSLESISLPSQVFSGERFPIQVAITSPRTASATVDLTAEGKTIGSSRVQLQPGVNRLRLQATVNSVGAIAMAGRVSAEGLGELRFEDAVTLRRPRALFISDDPPGSERHLLRALEANQFEVTRANGVPDSLQDFQIVTLNNWNLEHVPARSKAALEEFVKSGGGLLTVAGERNVYLGRSEEDPLERALPARVAPPRSPEGATVVLILDKSSSMEGRKIELARLAATGVVENLRPIDSVGVLVFDNSYEWAVPIRRADDRAGINALIAGIEADGGTQIAPALSEAYRRILPVKAVTKHIVLLTDGISEEGDALTVSREARKNSVTISTLGLGQDVNRGFLERVAATAEGKSYFLSDPSGLEQILLRDVEEHAGATAVEKPIRPKVVNRAEILDGVGMENAPPLHGYVRFEARPTSDTILEASGGDPLLVRWQYGLGRAAVFTSDAKNRWAAEWVTWPGFGRLWSNIFHDLLPHAPPTETTTDYDKASGELVVDYRFSRSVEAPAAPPDIFVFGPDGFHVPLRVARLTAGHYRGRIPIGQRQGLFRVRPVAESRAFPEVGFYRGEDELAEYGANDHLLRQIAAATGGRFNPAPSQVFDSGGRSVESTMDLWPLLLSLALALNIAELILRKWKGFLSVFRPTVNEA